MTTIFLVARGWLGLVFCDIAGKAGFAWLHACIRRCPVRRIDRRRELTTEQIVWAVEEACVWYVKRAHCLQRSLVATWLLRRYGRPAELVIGFRALPFESHAWVEVDGQVVNDRPQYQKHFRVLDRLLVPEPARSWGDAR